MMRFGLKDIIVNPGITDQSKYDYLFSVDALNEKVLQGMPFRDAYKSLGAEIAKGTYLPKRDINHTHIGSIGAPGFEQIKAKMQRASDWSNN
jgi:argininosuccinate lyase